MNPTRKPLFHRLQLRLAQARFFTFSALLHLVIVIMGGSVVLIRNVVEPPDFEAGPSEGLFSPEASPAPPPEAPPVAMSPEFTPAAPQASAPSIEAITSTAITGASFAIQASPAAISLDHKLSKLSGAAGKGMSDAIDKAMSGAARAGGTGGFYGMREQTVPGLVGSFYDLKQTRSRKPTHMSVEEFGGVLSRFVKGGWRPSLLNDYFKAPAPLTATQVFIPNMSANEAPKAFDVEKEVQPGRWVVHYQGRVAPPTDGTIRFVGAGDDYLVVRFNGKLVLDHGFYKATDWQPDQYYDYGWTKVPKGFARGEKIRVRAGQFYDLEILISERPGGLVFFCLMLEEEGVAHEKDARGNPILPVFRVANSPVPALTGGQTLPPFSADGPVWKAQSARRGASAFDQLFSR